MKVNSKDFERAVQQTFPYKVEPKRVDNADPAALIWDTEAFLQCTARLGPCASAQAVRRPDLYYWTFNRKAKWDVVGDTFYFATEADAAVFKIHWC